MKLGLWRKSIQNKYSQLLATLMVMFLAAPFLQGIIGRLLFSAVFLKAIITIIRTLNLKKRLFFMLLILAGAAFSLDIYNSLQPEAPNSTLVLAYGVYSLFIFTALITISKKIFSQKKVNSDTIQGGIVVFFLIGVAWTLLYRIVHLLDPNAFSKSGDLGLFDTFFYFSFTTLTTLGYGDITPVSNAARTLANLEAIVGMLYPSIFIARLVGLYTAQEMIEDD